MPERSDPARFSASFRDCLSPRIAGQPCASPERHSAPSIAPEPVLRSEPAATEQRFTLDGSDDLELHLRRVSDQVLEGVRSIIPSRQFEALVLGGGYGRGEGGVLRTDAGDRPYNDLEFYVFVRGNRIWLERRHRHALSVLGESLSPVAGLHVEFKIDSIERLRRSPVSMFTYDLVSGHRVVFGRNDLFAHCSHHLDARALPAAEGARLLFNRCTGLLLAKELLRREALTAEEADFVGRNLAKARLALGDALLTAFGRYHWSCRERQARLARLDVAEPIPRLDDVRRHHAAGAEFKLHPRRISQAVPAFQSEHRELSDLALEIWLWLESRRLARRFSSARDYALSRVRKCSGTSVARNVWLNARTFGAGSLLDPQSLRYPRERLINSLALLLWGGAGTGDRQATRLAQKQLGTSEADWPGLVQCYKRAWPDFG